MKICKVDACKGRHYGHGYCNKHYINARRNGTPLVMKPRGLPLMEMLLARIPYKPDVGCWEWGGTRWPAGYGVMKWNGRNQAAHRLMFNAVHGYYPVEVRHRCDNPPCCRPDHLEGGERQDNVDDRVNRGRSARLPGRSNPNARYTEEQVSEVLHLLADGYTGKAVAEMTGVDKAAVSRFRNGKR